MNTRAIINEGIPIMQMETKSYFDGGLLQFITWTVLGVLVTIFSFGLFFPWAFTMIYGWKAKHTVIEGRRLKFTGSALGLFGNWVKWWILCIITFGVYSFWVFLALERWKTRHTLFID
ncbi:DUF898 domain-containing protein [Mesobacillus harenae]|uniref:DUF898 domain-containing protein n=1 Tax=Mesobacillus harenae TaxID=2213203 RepID=UPI001F54C837|nr:DUF898 domain-containing protein [Mesobacillus harenae]